MKKLSAALLAALMLVGCSSKPATNNEPAETAEATAEVAAEGGLRMGLGSSTSISASDAEDAETNGSIQFNTTYAGIVLDADDVIKFISIDVAQNSAKFGVDGVITTEADAATPTKKEKGEAYNMKGASPIGLEWNEQAAGFEAWAVGKKLSDVLGMPTETLENGHVVSTDADLLTTTTISIDAFIAAVDAAAKNAVPVEGAAQFGVGSSTSLKLSDAEDAETTGSVQANTTYAMVAVDADNNVVKTITDVAQNTVKFTVEGLIDGEAVAAKTKKEKGAEYNMKGASPIGLEWDEQNAGFEAWTEGKALADVLATPTETLENGHIVSTDADLLTSTTISIDGHLKALTAASNYLAAPAE